MTSNYMRQNANTASQDCAGNERLGMAWRLLQELRSKVP